MGGGGGGVDPERDLRCAPASSPCSHPFPDISRPRFRKPPLAHRYFHPPLENVIAGLAGALLFQAPMLLFNATAIRALKAAAARTPVAAAGRQSVSERDALLEAVRAPAAGGLAIESRG